MSKNCTCTKKHQCKLKCDLFRCELINSYTQTYTKTLCQEMIDKYESLGYKLEIYKKL